jgi:adenine deaminase
MTITGNIVDVLNRSISFGTISIDGQKIKAIDITSNNVDFDTPYILPGFIDSHVHIESSLLIPSQFARLAVLHGTVATISDPHEIANVCGRAGIRFMLDDASSICFHFFFGAPSCVPASAFETAGATLTLQDTEDLLKENDIWYLSEMMNFPGVLQGDKDVLAKIYAAVNMNKPIDGHAPGLRGQDAVHYSRAGSNRTLITTDHECFTKAEALDKLACGMKIIIREGSAARNFDALIDLMSLYPDQLMFGTDDKHPDSLLQGHINTLCARAVARGMDVFDVLRAACITPVLHYKLPVGLLKENDSADLVVVKDLVNFKVQRTIIRGNVVADNGVSKLSFVHTGVINNFADIQLEQDDLKWNIQDAPITDGNVPVIVVEDGQLITKVEWNQVEVSDNEVLSDPVNDILKIVVVNRYRQAKPAVGLVKNFKLQDAAIASSVAHDSHNIIATGSSDELIFAAIQQILAAKGGLSFATNLNGIISTTLLPLPVAGLMTNADAWETAEKYIVLDQLAKSAGSNLRAPYMTLSFMALLVIPHIKLSDLGLFDGDRFSFYQDVIHPT